MGAEPQRSLLIVDDTEMFRLALAAQAKSCGRFSSVSTAVDGRQALEMIEAAVNSAGSAGIPEIVITDLYMPDINGVELMLTLKSEPLTADITGVMTSVCESPAERAAAREAGCRAFFLKPPTLAGMRDLLETVHRLAGRPAAAA